MQQRVESTSRIDVKAMQRQARVDLAAAHRICVHEGLHEGIFNHLTLAVPGADDRYYQIPFGLHWSEVTASCLMEVGYDGKVLAGAGDVELSAWAIHAPIHERLPETAACVMHTHMPYASALTRLEDMRILAIGQTEVGMMRDIAYDTEYAGPAIDRGEGERLAGILGDKSILFMANHGITTVGRTVAEAYDRLYYIERAAQVQLHAMWTGKPLKVLSPAIVDTTLRDYASPQYGGKASCEHHFAALKRLLDRREPDYKD